MVPGMPDYLVPQSGDEASNRRLKKFMYMMDSMTDKELDGVVDMHNKLGKADAAEQIESRIKRIARGSGTHPNEVKMLLQCHKQFGGMVTKMGKSGMLKGNNAAKQKQLMEQMKNNPGAALNRLNQMNPQMLQQMGGRDAVMQMVSYFIEQSELYFIPRLAVFYKLHSLPCISNCSLCFSPSYTHVLKKRCREWEMVGCQEEGGVCQEEEVCRIWHPWHK